MGTTTEPVAGSGSCPAWIARVSKSIAFRLLTKAVPPDRRRFRVHDLGRVEPLRQALDRARDSRPRAGGRARFGPETLDPEHLRRAIESRLDPPDGPVTAQDRQDVVAVLPLRLRDVHLEPVEEVPERLGTIAVLDEPVERGEERDTAPDGAGVRVRMGDDPVPAELDALRAKPFLLENPPRLGERQRLGLRPDALGEIPQALA